MTIEDAHSVADHRNTTARALVPRGIAVRSLLLDDQCRAVLKQVSIGAHDAVVVADRYPRRALRGLARRSPVPIVIVAESQYNKPFDENGRSNGQRCVPTFGEARAQLTEVRWLRPVHVG